MNAETASTSTSTINSTTNNWGFKTPIQFEVAMRLAQGYGHLWAKQKGVRVEVRTPTPSGAFKLEEEWVYTDPSSPQEAHEWASQDPFGGRSEPTPKWESGTSTFKVDVFPSGQYSTILNGMVKFLFDRDGKVLSFALTPNWLSSWCGRAITGNEAILMTVALSQQWGVNKDLIELFESDRQFWRTGFVAGTRWCRYEREGRLGCGGFVIDLH